MPSEGQVTFYTGSSSQDGNDNHFWNNDNSDPNKNFLRFGSSNAKQTFIQVIDRSSPPTQDPYNNDFWLVANAKFDGSVWNRVDTSKPAFGLNLRAMTDIPFESGTKGVCLWVAQPGSNPIGNFGASDGWQAIWIATQYKDLVVGGFGIEIDGNQSTGPYGRVLSNGGNVGILTNLFLDLAAHDRDVVAQSWFAGIVGDAFKVRRDPTPTNRNDPINWVDFLNIASNGKVGVGSTSPAEKLHVVGTIREESATYAGRKIDIYTTSSNRIEATNDLYVMAAGGMSMWTGGSRRIGINQSDGKIFLGTDSENPTPINSVDINGNVAIGAAYASEYNAPTNGLIVQGNVGIGTHNPQGALDVNSTTGALIVPRMTEEEREQLSPVNGMIIYNTSGEEFNFYENGQWVAKQNV